MASPPTTPGSPRNPESPGTPNLDHPTLAIVKAQFPDQGITATEFRDQTTLVLPPDIAHEVFQFLRDDPQCAYDFLSEVLGIDYLNYPSHPTAPPQRFAVVYNMVSTQHNTRLFAKVMLDPSIPTDGIADDPALHLSTVTDIWPGAEWNEREVFDMFGIRFDGHPDLRRILTWEAYPAHPLRKDYPLKGRGERENFAVVTRDSA